MDRVPTDWTPGILQLGANGVLLLILWMIVRDGSLRTRFELDSEINRRKRAEEQVDTLLPALKEQTATVQRLSDGWKQVADVLDSNGERMDRLSDRMWEIAGQMEPQTEHRRSAQVQRQKREESSG